MTKRKILLDIKWEIDGKVAAFERHIHKHEIIDLRDHHGDDFSGISYAVVWKPQPGLLAKLPDLEVIFSLGAGVDHVFEDPHLPDVPVVRFVDPDLTGRMVEWIVLQVLMHLRQQRAYDAQQRDHLWAERAQPAASDIRVGIMGFGELGQASAEGLKPLGFKLSAWSRTRKSTDGVRSFAGEEELDAFLAQTDILVCLLPYTQETHGIINAPLINRLAKDGALGGPVIINGGRGGSQVEADIVAALEDGRLKGVSLDVFEQEPLPEDSPLWDMKNAIITPHVAAISDADALAKYVATMIELYEASGELENVVDAGRGY